MFPAGNNHVFRRSNQPGKPPEVAALCSKLAKSPQLARKPVAEPERVWTLHCLTTSDADFSGQAGKGPVEDDAMLRSA